jgi:ABC-2 type transport system ATP-binding protein
MTGIQFRNVTFAYRAGRPVLRDFSFEFEGGSTLLLGPNGAGKSTLLGLAASALTPRSGEIRMGDLEAAGSSLSAFRRALAWMPQQVSIFPGLSVREQVAYVGWLKGLAKDEAWERSADALARVNLEHQTDRRPGTLSGGERRRLGVAQTLVHEAPWVLMDEPTAGLDPAQRADLQTLIHSLRGSASVVVSTHVTDDIDAGYERVVVLGAGEVRFSGTTEAFLALAHGASDSSRVVSAYRRALSTS